MLTRYLIVGLTALSFSSGVAAQESLKQTINPPEMTNSLQYGYSQATVAPADAILIEVAGQVGVAEKDDNGFKAQVDRAFANMARALTAAGGKTEDVIKITLLIADHDPDKLAYLVTKRKAFFGDNPPASVLIPVTRLYTDGVDFEIAATAVASSQQ